VPRCVVADEYVPLALDLNILVGVVEKDLKDLGICMVEHESIEFPGSGTDHSRDTHPNVGTLVGSHNLLSAQCPSSPGPWISLDACLIKEPNVRVRIEKEDFEQFDKGLSLFLILSVRPRAGHFEPEPFFMEPTKYDAIANLSVQLFGQVSMELLACPMSLVSLLRMPDQVSIFCAFFRRDFLGPIS